MQLLTNNYSYIRLFSILIIGVAALSLSKIQFVALFTSILFSHYLLSFIFSWKQFNQLFFNKNIWPPLVILIFITILYVQTGFYIVYLVPFIGIHVALSETYMINLWHLNEIENKKTIRNLNLSRFLLNCSMYFLLVYWVKFDLFYEKIIMGGVIIGSLIYFTYAVKSTNSQNKFKVNRFVMFELLGGLFVLTALICHFQISPQYFVFYHIVTWLVFSFFDFCKKQVYNKLYIFLSLVISTTFLFYILNSDLIFKDVKINLVNYIPLWATLHFMSTFSLSRLNPVFITRFFYRT